MLTEAETKEIEQLAMEYVSITRPSSFPNGRQEGYIAGATAMAEKKNVEIEEHKEAVQNLHDGYDICKSDYQKVITKYKAQLEAAQAELEKERLRLAACGVAALSNTEESIKNQKLAPDSEYYSGSYEDVCRAVNREMHYRTELERVKAAAEKMAMQLRHYVNSEDEIGTQILKDYEILH